MKKLLIKKIILWTLVFLCMSTIFYFSTQPSDKSKATSSFFTEIVNDVIKILPFSDEIKLNLSEGSEHFVRKTAHFTEFFVLGALTLSACLSSFKKKNFYIAFIIGFLYAISDEIHQIFVPGRAFLVSDIILDTAGVLVGEFIFVYLRYLFKIKKKLPKEEC